MQKKDVFGQVIMKKFLPQVSKFHEEKLHKEKEDKLKDFLSKGVTMIIKESEG